MKHSPVRRLTALLFFSLIIIASKANAQALSDSIPKGWRNNITANADVIINVDTIIKRSGSASAFLYYTPNTFKQGTAHLWQTLVADKYRGKRVRISMYAKSADVYSGFLYMRVEGLEHPLTFANTNNNRIEKTTDWTPYQITLDVPVESQSIFFGVILMYAGSIWVDDFNFEIVDQSVPSDDILSKAPPDRPKYNISKRDYIFNKDPVNLNFEDN